MKLFAATIMSLSLLVSAPAHANETSASSGSVSGHIKRRFADNYHHAKRLVAVYQGVGPILYWLGTHRHPLFQTKDPSHTCGAYVTFDSGARSAWHTHPLGQTPFVPLCTDRRKTGIFSLNTNVIDDSPVRRYSSRQKKGV